jgi:hypothetical protein
MPRKEVSQSKKASISPSSESIMMRPVTYTGPIMSLPSGSPSIAAATPSAPSFGQIIKEGFAFGIGSSIAQRLFGPSRQIVPQTPAQTPLETASTNSVSKNIKDMTDQVMYHQCILEGGTEETCKQYIV